MNPFGLIAMIVAGLALAIPLLFLTDYLFPGTEYIILIGSKS